MADEIKATATNNFEVVTTEAAETEQAPEPAKAGEQTQDQNTEGDESATAQKQDEGKQEGQDDDKDSGKDDADEQDADDDAGEEANHRRGRGRFQKRIDRLTKRAAEAERRAQEAERKLQEAEGKNGGKAKPEAQDDEGEPDPSDFDSYDEYLDALADWKADQKIGAKGKKDDKAAADDDNGSNKDDQDTEFTEALEDVQDAFSETRKSHKDFDEVIGQQDLQITRDMVIAMADSEDPGAIAYHLGKNKQEAARIAKLSPIAQAKEIGKIEAKLAAKPQQPGKKTTSAPDPIDPVKGSDSTSKAPQDMDFAEYERTQNEKEQRGGRGFW